MQKYRNSFGPSKTSHLEHDFIHEAFSKNGVETPIEKYNLKFHHWRKLSGRLDPENICTKWITDALVGSGILQDDGFENMPNGFHIYPPTKVNHYNEEKIVITIEGL